MSGIRKQLIAPGLLCGLTAACALVAAAAGRPAWAAALGAGLALLYWALEALTWRRARTRSGLALGLAVGGMALRLAAVLAVLVAVGLLARSAFATTAVAFMVAFGVYQFLKPLTYSTAGAAGHHRALS